MTTVCFAHRECVFEGFSDSNISEPPPPFFWKVIRPSFCNFFVGFDRGASLLHVESLVAVVLGAADCKLNDIGVAHSEYPSKKQMFCGNSFFGSCRDDLYSLCRMYHRHQHK